LKEFGGFLVRSFLWVVVALGLFFITGCSSFDEISSGENGGVSLPPGVVINKGTGPVLSSQDAFRRVASQYLGITLPGQVNGRDDGGAFIGGVGEPSVNLYQAPDGPLAVGATVAEWDAQDQAYTLQERYYLFWADPNPRARLGHRCSFLYLRQRDGLLIEGEVDFDPTVNGARIFELPAQRLDNLCYTHKIWIDWGVSPLSPTASRVQPQILAQGIGMAGGPDFHALAVIGATDTIFNSDVGKYQNYFTGIGGDAADFDSLDDDPGDRVTEDELRQKLIDANDGLGPDDKFLFCLSSHGSDDGYFALGTGQMSWQELCLLLDQTVTAGNLNIVIDTCYSGLAAEAFEGWTGPRRVRLVTGTGTATPAYTGVNLECMLEKLLGLAEAAALDDGVLTLNELEKTFSDLDLTLAELEEKACADLNTQADLDWKKNEYETDPTSPGKKFGSDNRPGMGEIAEFFHNWGTRVSAEDSTGLRPFYSSTYFYNGQDLNSVVDFSGGFDFEFGDIELIDVTHVSAEILATINLNVSISAPGLAQREQRQMEFRLRGAPTQPQLYIIDGQRVVEQQTTGTTGNTPPGIPTPPHIDSGALNQLSGLTVAPGDPFIIQVSITGLSNTNIPGQTNNVGLALGGQFFQLVPQGGNLFQGVVIVPNLSSGLYVLELFAENRVTNQATNGQAYAGTHQSAELNVRQP
jgi:hypothetical protein